METWLKLLFCVILLGFAVVVLFQKSRREKETFALWQQLASRFGFSFSPPAPGWFRAGGGRVRGEHAGCPIEIVRVVRGSGRSRHNCTRVTSALRESLPSAVRVRRRGWFDFPRLRGLPRIRSESSSDEPFVVWSDDARAARALLDGDISKSFAGFSRRASLDVVGAEVVLEWRGLERDPEVLVHALDLVTSAARAARSMA